MTYSYLWVFNLQSLACPSVLSYDWQLGSVPLLTSGLDPRLLLTILASLASLALLRTVATSQIKVKVTNKEPEASSVNFENQEDILQEELDQLFLSRESESMSIIDEEEDSEEFLSSPSPQVITIGNEDDEVETAEEALIVDIPDASPAPGAKQDKCIIS